MEHPTTIAVDLAKSVFEIAVSTKPGRVSQRRRLTRSQMASFFANRPSATVLMEACGTAHFWGRLLRGLGHRVLLLPAQHVCRYRLRDKTDAADALALLEAHRNQKIVPVPVKDVPEQAIASLHRIRSGWIATRTARLNAVRGLLRELGINILWAPNWSYLASRTPSRTPTAQSPKASIRSCSQPPPKSVNSSRTSSRSSASSKPSPDACLQPRRCARCPASAF